MKLGVVIMVHGAGGGGWEYDLWKPVFAKAGARVIARDLVPSKGGLEKTHFEDYVQQVRSWIPQGTKPVLIGASMGGILALKVAELVHPAAVVLVNSAPPAGVGPVPPAPKHPAVVRWANGPLKDTRDAMPDSDEKTILWAWPRWRDESGTVMNTIGKRVVAQKPKCPVLSVLGTNDTDVKFKTGLALAEWASADVHIYAGMSHVGPLMSKRSGEVAESIIRWLEKR